MYSNTAESEKEESLTRLQKHFQTFEKKLSIYQYLKEGDKIGKVTEKYSIFRAGYMQTLTRWWWGEDRTSTLDYIDRDFTTFAKYLDTLLDISKVSSLEAYEKLTHDTIDFINRIILGLYNLKKTYDDYNQLVCKIDSIILILIDFKDKISVKKGPRIIFRRRDSF